MSRKGVPNIDSFKKHNILQDYRSGMPCTLICQKYHVGENYPRLLAKRQGLTQRNKYLQGWERQAIADAYEAGEKSEAIAAEFNIHRAHVREVAKSFGHPPRPMHRPRKQDEREGLHA